MLKICCNNKKIIIVNHNQKNKAAINANSLVFNDSNINSFTEILSALKSEAKSNKLFVLSDNILMTIRKILRELRLIKAAGGMVINERNELLMIYRNNMWDLPKGKIEKGESIRHTAIREVEEECGVSGLKMNSKLPNTYHIYKEKGKYILKKSFWYKMMTADQTTPLPQINENITKALWLPGGKVAQVLPYAYPSIQELLMERYL